MKIISNISITVLFLVCLNLCLGQAMVEPFAVGISHLNMIRLLDVKEKNLAVINYDKIGRVEGINEYVILEGHKDYQFAKGIVYYRDANTKLSSVMTGGPLYHRKSDYILSDIDFIAKYNKDWQLNSTSNGGTFYFKYVISNSQISRINTFSEKSDLISYQEIGYDFLGRPKQFKSLIVSEGKIDEGIQVYDGEKSFTQSFLVDSLHYPVFTPFNFIQIGYLHNPNFPNVRYTYNSDRFPDTVIVSDNNIIRKYLLTYIKTAKYQDLDNYLTTKSYKEIYIQPYNYTENNNLIDYKPSFDFFIGKWINAYSNTSRVHTIEIIPSGDKFGKPLTDKSSINIQMSGIYLGQYNFRYYSYDCKISEIENGLLHGSDKYMKSTYTISKMMDGRLRLTISLQSPITKAGTKEEQYVIYFRKSSL